MDTWRDSTTHGKFHLWTLAETVQLMENFTYGHFERQYNSWKISLMNTCRDSKTHGKAQLCLLHRYYNSQTCTLYRQYNSHKSHLCTLYRHYNFMKISLMYTVQTLQF